MLYQCCHKAERFKPCPAYSDLPCSFHNREDEMPCLSLHALSTSQGGGVSPPTLGAPTHAYLKAPQWKQQEKKKRKKNKKPSRNMFFAVLRNSLLPCQGLAKLESHSPALALHTTGKSSAPWENGTSIRSSCPAQGAAAFPGISFPRSTDSQGFS